MKSLLLAALLAVVSVVTFAVPVRAADQAFHEAYSFTLSPAQCADVSTTISGAGEYWVRINERTDINGVTHTVINVTTAGTATDAEGNTYRYNYHNHHNMVTQPGGFPQIDRTTDHFNLVGAGGANSVHVGFTLIFTFAAPGQEPTITEISLRGDPMHCDPI
jgi:hypothetical protein